jgi:hypothetical protein
VRIRQAWLAQDEQALCDWARTARIDDEPVAFLIAAAKTLPRGSSRLDLLGRVQALHHGIGCLNSRLDGITLVPTMRKPFDVLAEGLLLKNTRGDRTPIELFLAGVAGWEPYVERLLMAA